VTYWRYILHGLFLLALTTGSAVAATDTAAAGNSITVAAAASDSTLNDASWFFPASYFNQYQPSAIVQATGGSNAICKEQPIENALAAPAITALVNREMDEALIDDEALGRVSGGAILFTAPDAARPRLFAIILWDEVKSRRTASSEQGNGQIISTMSVQQFK